MHILRFDARQRKQRDCELVLSIRKELRKIVTTETLTPQEAFKQANELYQKKEYAKALEISVKRLQTAPTDIDLKYITARCLYKIGDYIRAESLFGDCYSQVPHNSTLCFDIGLLYAAKGNIQKAITFYQQAISLNPQNIGALNNLGNIYNNQGNSDIALQCFNKILEINPNVHFIYNNISLIYKKAGMLHEALTSILKSLEINANIYESQQNAAQIYMSMGDNPKAAHHYEKAYTLQPNDLNVAIEYLDVLGKLCDWDKFKVIESEIKKMIGDKILPVMCSMQQNETSEKTLKTARVYTLSVVKNITAAHPRFVIDENRKKKKDKLRIAYMSSDIKDHPVAHLMRGVFKNHNKDEFEIYLYSFSSDDKTHYKQQIASYCNKFIDVRHYSNYETAKMIHNDEIDILIDLNGHTGSPRIEALALKPAPIQVNYLGYIGTMGADFIDYIITDNIVTPPKDQPFYDEKFVYMPDCYQANDNELEISTENITKQSEGLPEDKFIFCSFNQTYKIEPVMFDVWMNILKRVPDSVLWLYKGSIYPDDFVAAENLKNQAQKRGVDAGRLIFAEGIAIDKHLKRIGLADLALDTRLYNGGTVTSQTLWAGTPVLTLEGWHFPSRMASSILQNIGLPELVKKTAEEYEDFAVHIANNPDKRAALKEKLLENRNKEPLFDTAGFTKNLEQAYKLMWENYTNGNDPNTITVSKE